MITLSPPTVRDVEVTRNDPDEIRVRVRHLTFVFPRVANGFEWNHPVRVERTASGGVWVHETWLRMARELARERLDSILKGHAPNREAPPQRCGECGALVVLPDREPRLDELICGPEHVACYADGARAIVHQGERAKLFGPDGLPMP